MLLRHQKRFTTRHFSQKVSEKIDRTEMFMILRNLEPFSILWLDSKKKKKLTECNQAERFEKNSKNWIFPDSTVIQTTTVL